jgi:Cap4 SAVED domain
MTETLPDSVLEIVVTEPHESVRLLGVCAGYEDGCWRCSQLSLDLLNWALDWVLTPSELEGFGQANALLLMTKALSRIYTSKKYEKRGEVGELLLHVILRRFMRSQKIISRIYFKDAPNDTVKGFDAVHLVEPPEGNDDRRLQLWLGESKFYTDSGSAMNAVLAELKDHLETGYLRTEFAAISDKIPQGWSHESEIKGLLNRTLSLDEVFQRVVIPVFITFDSPTTIKHTVSTGVYLEEIANELRDEWQSFRDKLEGVSLPREVQIHLILLPMATKRALIDQFDERLKSWQVATQT